MTTHVHDNDGRHDDHLIPYAGTIDWDAAMMETQKIGYDGVLMFERMTPDQRKQAMIEWRRLQNEPEPEPKKRRIRLT